MLAVAADHSRVSLDTFKGQMASAREKLGVENTNQLRAALRELSKR
jgi:DNA-binding CsgD family transcriptional regulator